MGSMEDQEHHVVLTPQEQTRKSKRLEQMMVRRGSSLEDQEHQVVLAPQEQLGGGGAEEGWEWWKAWTRIKKGRGPDGKDGKLLGGPGTPVGPAPP